MDDGRARRQQRNRVFDAICRSVSQEPNEVLICSRPSEQGPFPAARGPTNENTDSTQGRLFERFTHKIHAPCL